MIIHGDCLVELQKLEDKSADLILIDPPYNIGKEDWDNFGYTKKGYQPKEYSGESYYDWMEEVFVQLSRVMKDSGSFWFFHNDFRIMLNWIIESNSQLILNIETLLYGTNYLMDVSRKDS